MVIREVPDGVILLGVADIKREGTDVIFLLVKLSKHIAAEELAKEGISEIIDLRTVRPMDYDAIIASVKKQIV
jgi:pyruvate dehydrogenase E1 component beta subunit